MANLHITLHPEDFHGNIGDTASFHVEAVGNNLTYKWQYLTTASGATWKDSTSTGYNTNTLSIELTSARNGQKYRCKVTSGSNTVISEPATLLLANSISKVVYKDRTLIDLTEDTVTAAKMLSGITAHAKDGNAITGTIASQAAKTYNASTSEQSIASGKYLSGKQTIRAITTAGITAENIKAGAVVKVGDSGSATRIKNVTGTFTADATAAAVNISSGKTAYVNGNKLTGTYVPYISFANKTIATSAWESDATYSDYPYRAAVACSGATADMFPYVEFSEADAQSNLFFEGAASYSGGVYVYASAIPSAAITIPTITFYKRS